MTILKGRVEKTNIRYKWVTEKDACEKCKKLEGTEFESLEEFEAARPHPHCKCSPEPVYKEPDDTLKRDDELQKAQEEIDTIKEEEDKQAQELQERKEMLEEIENLQNEAQAVIKNIDKTIPLIDDGISELKQLESNKLELSTIELEDVKRVKEDLIIVKQDVLTYRSMMVSMLPTLNVLMFSVVMNKEMPEIAKELKIVVDKFFETKDRAYRKYIAPKLKKVWDFVIKIQGKNLQTILNRVVDVASVFNLHESGSMWKLATSHFTEGLEYVTENGKLIKRPENLKDEELVKKVKAKLASQNLRTDLKGVYKNSKSSLAKKIDYSFAIRGYIRANKHKFQANTQLNDQSLGFSFFNADLNMGIHYTDIIDIYIDENENFRAKILDTYDFNEDSDNLFVREARLLQEEDKLENYYTITEICIPKSRWKKY